MLLKLRRKPRRAAIAALLNKDKCRRARLAANTAANK